MKLKLKLIFSVAIVAALIALPRANAATPGGTTSTTANSNSADAVTALFGDPVVAKGAGVQVKQSDLDEVMTGMKSAAAAHGETIPPEQMTRLEAQMLDRLIDIQLLLQKSTDADKAAGAKKASEQMAALLDRAGSQATLDMQLKAVGMTQDELRKKVTQEATAMAALQRELGVNVTDADVKKFYDDHPSDFEQPETVHVRHILLMTMDPTTHTPLPADQVAAKKKQIEDILKRARAGEDFAKLAEQYSDDTTTKDNGGELPPFSRGQMLPEFEAAAFSLTNNQISDVVTTMYGYHIIQLIGKTPAKTLTLADKLPSSDETVSDKIKDYLGQQKTDELAPPYLEKLKKTADVKILDPDLDAAVEALSNTNAPPAE